jgi:hypothetical protein
MNPPEHEIDGLVRAHLERQAGAIDPNPLSARIWNTMERRAAAPRKTFVRGLSWAAAAAALLLAFFGGSWIQPVRASPATIVREAQKAHLLPLDRCYLVETVRNPALPDELAPLASQWPTTRLWTRGDRFWIESTNPRARWAWGRDEKGGIWMASGQGYGIRFDPDETPRWLSTTCDVFSMQMETLLDEVLRNFELLREPAPAAAGSASIAIRAEPRPGRPHPRIGGAVLEIDAETRVVRRLVLNRTRQDQAIATVTYTLVETAARDLNLYQIEGHLQTPFEIYSRDREPDRRIDLLVRWFGPKAADWFKAPPGRKKPGGGTNP